MRDNEEFKKLQQRVNAVEEENEALRQQIARFLPDGETRRQFLKMGATGVGGLGIGLALSGGASGQSVGGNIGTSGTPVNNIYTDSITDGSSGTTYDIDSLAGGSVSGQDITPDSVTADDSDVPLADDTSQHFEASRSGTYSQAGGMHLFDGGGEVINNNGSINIRLQRIDGVLQMTRNLVWDDANTAWALENDSTAGMLEVGKEGLSYFFHPTGAAGSTERYLAARFGGDAEQYYVENDDSTVEGIGHAIDQASEGARINAAPITFSDDRTIDQSGIEISGTSMTAGTAQIADGTTWTISEPSVGITNMYIVGELRIGPNSDGGQYIHNCVLSSLGTITVNHNNVSIVGCKGAGTIDFASGTSGGLVDSMTGGPTINDNGTNTEGNVV